MRGKQFVLQNGSFLVYKENNMTLLALSYKDLIQECRQAGWKAWNYPVDVGCRGFPAPSLGKMFQYVGIVGQARKLAIKKASQSAEKIFQVAVA